MCDPIHAVAIDANRTVLERHVSGRNHSALDKILVASVTRAGLVKNCDRQSIIGRIDLVFIQCSHCCFLGYRELEESVFISGLGVGVSS